MAKLLVQESTGVREFELVDAEIHIGRELDNALRLSDPSISRHHAILRQVGNSYELQDLQSSNGVLVNGTRIQTSPLMDGDRLTLGQVQMTFVNPQPTEAISVNPLGTVRLSSEDVAKLQATPGGAPDPLEVTPQAELPVVQPSPLPPPAAPAVAPIALALPPPTPQAPPPVAPNPAPAPTSFTASAANPAPGFLQRLLPPVPDDAIPTGERGDFVTRLCAHVLDGVIFAVPVIVLMIVGGVLTAILARIIGPGVAFLGCIFSLLYFVICIGYIIFIPWCWMKFGATPGKKIMKLRVVPEDDPYGRIELGPAVLRMVGHWVNGMIFSLPYLMILGAERKGLQDMFSKSIVIKVDR
ncbi:FHA domain-containing protein [Holophaga foetida]|uniref:FHA domain-containing protein n=1 Tax=Holophaga foetida TaxID=35839 RepID=UPI00024742FB|nr:FHA domain-containing protein [Holophaga foetida]